MQQTHYYDTVFTQLRGVNGIVTAVNLTFLDLMSDFITASKRTAVRTGLLCTRAAVLDE